MEEFSLQQAISFHAFIAYCLLFITIIHLVSLLFIKDFIKIHKITWFLTPLFFGFLFILALSGISVLAMMKFSINLRVCFMIIFCFIFILEIIRVKKMRVARLNISIRKSYINFSRILNSFYVIFLMILLVV